MNRRHRKGNESNFSSEKGNNCKVKNIDDKMSEVTLILKT